MASWPTSASLLSSSSIIEQRVARKDGSSAWLSTLKVPLFDKAGAILGLLTHNRDVTDLKRLEDEHETAEDLVANADHALYAAKAAGRDRMVASRPRLVGSSSDALDCCQNGSVSVAERVASTQVSHPTPVWNNNGIADSRHRGQR
jgi:hypothetical protein